MPPLVARRLTCFADPSSPTATVRHKENVRELYGHWKDVQEREPRLSHAKFAEYLDFVRTTPGSELQVYKGRATIAGNWMKNFADPAWIAEEMLKAPMAYSVQKAFECMQRDSPPMNTADFILQSEMQISEPKAGAARVIYGDGKFEIDPVRSGDNKTLGLIECQRLEHFELMTGHGALPSPRRILAYLSKSAGLGWDAFKVLQTVYMQWNNAGNALHTRIFQLKDALPDVSLLDRHPSQIPLTLRPQIMRLAETPVQGLPSTLM